MRNKLSKYSVVCFFFIGSFFVFADGPPIGPVHECCELIYKELDPDNPDPNDPNDPNNPLYQEYIKCQAMESANAGSYCNPIVPIDNSRYVYISMVAGVALASFVIARAVERKNKKTPM